jgi:hypothetical protein
VCGKQKSRRTESKRRRERLNNLLDLAGAVSKKQPEANEAEDIRRLHGDGPSVKSCGSCYFLTVDGVQS